VIGLEIIAEVEPTRSREKLKRWVPPLRGLVDWIDIPESPLGVPRAHSIAVASYIQSVYGIPSIAHLRVSDVNVVGLKSLVGAAVLLGVKRVVLLRGDKPSEGSVCSNLAPEDAIQHARNHSLGLVEVGLLVSARRDLPEIEERLSRRPDFILVLNATPERLKVVSEAAARVGARVYPYIIIETPRNQWLVKSMPKHVVRYEASKVSKIVESIKDIVDGVVLSVPGDYEGLRLVAEKLRR
jgi:hypothetical protein